MSDEKSLAEKLADKFCGWKLPDGVCPDNLDADRRFHPGSSGTNIMTWSQAKQMFEELVVPEIQSQPIQCLVSALGKVLKKHELEYFEKVLMSRIFRAAGPLRCFDRVEMKRPYDGD